MRGKSAEGEVLAVNLAFYEAMAARQLEAMEGIWARKAPVSCAHPGWPPLFGRDAVMESWAGILANPESPKIRCVDPRALLHGELALVICFEVIEHEVLVATNLFVKEGKAWKIAHHQAGPTIARPDDSGEPLSKRVH